MSLIALLNNETSESRKDMAIAVVVSGIANAVILAVINAAAQTASYEALNVRFLVIFVVAMALYITGLQYTFDSATVIFEQALTRIRVRLMEKIADSELLLLHRIGKARIFQAVTQDTALISESQGLLVAGAQSVVMVGSTAIYVIFLSFPAFLTIAGVIVVGILIYLAREKQMTDLIKRSAAEEQRFVGMTSDLVDGLKEIKLSRARGRDALADIDTVAVTMRDLKIKTTNLYNKNAVFSQGFFYTLIATIVFVLPRFIDGFAAEVPQLVSAILFIIGPLSTVVNASPAFAKSNRAASSLMALEAEINHVSGEPVTDYHASQRPLAFKQAIECRNLMFRYPGTDPRAFHIGPVDLAIPRGELTMIIGGNGSGKTTFLKVLAGLYAPVGGGLMLDDTAISPACLQAYRELFSAIYTDFHLFRKLYGVAAQADAIDAELRRMAIHEKVGYAADGFSTLDLSTGQRKRIAMVVALLEDRPILIFDEWAADQDPDFRRYFYEELLPALKAQDKTLLVATHDDRYFHMADTVVKMEMGRIQSVVRRETVQ
jgi:putative ATP-binding cassette transporter